MMHVWTGVAQALLLVAGAPLVQGVIKTSKARLQGRQGPPILQPYFDLAKYVRKDEVVSRDASWLFLATPYIVFAAMITATALVPAIFERSALAFSGDLLLVVYLFVMARFFTALAAIDTGSTFGAMGSSRDMFVSALAEPVFFVTALAVTMPVGMPSLSLIAARAQGTSFFLSPAYFLVFLAMVILILAETGRLPVDNQDTHLELTMIHEGMLLEYSGKRLGLMLWSSWIKQLMWYTLLIDFCLPWGISAGTGGFLTAAVGVGAFALKLLVIAMTVAVIEMSYAKIRLFRLPRLLSAALVLSVVALMTEYLW